MVEKLYPSRLRYRVVSIAALEPFGGALRGSATAGFRVRTVEPRRRYAWQRGDERQDVVVLGLFLGDGRGQLRRTNSAVYAHFARHHIRRADIIRPMGHEEHRAARVGLLANDDELFPAVTRRQVGFAHGQAHGLGEMAQDAVADFVPVQVVEALEMVEVEEDQRDVALVPAAALVAVGSPVGEVAGVVLPLCA